MVVCKVWYNDLHGKRHNAQVEADSLYEAAALAALEFARGGIAPGIIEELSVQIQQPVYRTTLAKVHAFTEWHGKTPREMTLKTGSRRRFARYRRLGDRPRR